MTTTRRIDISRKNARCPVCGAVCFRHSNGVRTIRDLGVSGAVVIRLRYSKHYCEACRRNFSVSAGHIAPRGSRFSYRVRRTAISLVSGDGMTLEQASRRMRQRHFVNVPLTTIHDWVRDAAV